MSLEVTNHPNCKFCSYCIFSSWSNNQIHQSRNAPKIASYLQRNVRFDGTATLQEKWLPSHNFWHNHSKVLPQCKVTLLRKISQGLVRITIRWWSLKCSNDIRRCLVNHFQNQTEVHTTYTDIAQRTDGTRANTSRANHPNLKVRSWYMRDHIIILRLNFPAKLQKTGKFPSLWLAFSSIIPNWQDCWFLKWHPVWKNVSWNRKVIALCMKPLL